jgi:hypothetical protein
MTKIDPAKFRKQADECHEQANEARSPIDQEAWLRLAEDFIKLAEGLEQYGTCEQVGLALTQCLDERSES